MSLELYFDTDSVGRQTITIDPISPTNGETYTLELFDVQIGYTATADTDANVVAGLKAAIDASTAAEWQDVTTSLTDSGDRLVLTYGDAVSGQVKIWRGDAPEISQVTRITPGTVTAGDQFALTVNGKAISYTATESTAANVVAGLQSLLSSSSVPEFSAFDADIVGDELVLTASESGVPFLVSTTTTSGNGAVKVATSTAAAAGVAKVQSFVIPETTATFRIRYRSEQTSLITTDSTTDADIVTALDALTNINNAAVVSSYGETYRELQVSFNDSTSDLLKPISNDLEFTVTTVSESPEVQTIEIPVTADADASYSITVDGFTTGPIPARNDVAEATVIAEVLAALSELPNLNISNGDVAVGNVYSVPNKYDLTFDAAFGDISPLSVQWVVEPVDSTIDADVITEGVATINQKTNVKIDADAGTFTLSADAQTTTALAYDSSTAAVETALEVLSSLDAVTVTGSPGNYTIEFTGNQSGTDVELTADGSSLTGTGTESLTVAESVASRGPNHWDDPLNWTPAGVPVTGETVSFEFGSSDCLYGIDQSAVLLASLQIAAGYSGNIGLKRINQSGFFEYRLRDLTIGATEIIIGHGDGSGSGKIQIDTGEDETAIVIHSTGGSSESGVPAFTWRGQHIANNVELLNGQFGTAVYSDQTSRIATFTQRGGDSSLHNCRVDRIEAPDASISCRNLTLGATNRLEI